MRVPGLVAIRRTSYLRTVGRISSRDYESILEIVAQVARGTPAEPIPLPVLAAIRRLIPCDVVAFFEGPPWDRVRRRIWIDGDARALTAAEKVLHDRFRFQNPLEPSPATIGRSLRISDFLTRRAYRASELYQLIGRTSGIEFGLGYWMRSPDGVVRGLSFDARERDFSQRDKDVLDVLGRHLGSILGRDDPRLISPATSLGITDRQAEILALVARGRTNREVAFVLSISPHTVRKHLENAFGRMKVHTRTEALAAIAARPEPRPAA
jgi:DNA-binding CsgD family transcriptional regulator